MDETNKSQSPRALALLNMDSKEGLRQLDALPQAKQLALLLELPAGRRRQDLVLLSSKPEALTRVISPEDLMLTIKEIGDVDALPLIELSSNSQLTHLLDLEIWLQNGLDLDRWGYWLNLLFECGPARVRRWVRNVDFEMLVLWFERVLIKVERDSLDDLPEVLQDRVLSPDHVHYLAVKVGADLGLIKKLLDLAFAEERDLFFALMGNLGTTPLAELEELAMRWRQGRLADRGWPELNEALAFYAPLEQEKLATPLPLPRGLPDAPSYPLVQRSAGGLFAQAMSDPRLGEAEHAQSLASQLANLINRVLVADGLPAGEIESMQTAGERVRGRIEIGLAQAGVLDLDSATKALIQIPLLQLVQVAQNAIAKRVRRAHELLESPWLSMLPAPLPDRLAYVGRRRPLYLAADKDLPRDFVGPEDLACLDRDLDRVEASLLLTDALGLKRDDLPQPFPLGSQPESEEALDLDAILMTCFLQAQSNGQAELLPIPADLLIEAMRKLPSEITKLADQISSWATAQDEALAQAAGLSKLSSGMAGRLLEQFVGHSPERMDYRFVEGVWVSVKE
ncbi:MAG: hypothetical protein JRF33_07635 [Deltaproteobacteria bacterium]|nr:hypothetical protein [Deltaproteobacteria bacterium]